MAVCADVVVEVAQVGDEAVVDQRRDTACVQRAFGVQYCGIYTGTVPGLYVSMCGNTGNAVHACGNMCVFTWGMVQHAASVGQAYAQGLAER